MKLRNKKTGEIVENCGANRKMFINTGSQIYNYSSLAELNEEWEDYEEPKECDYYIIESDGTILKSHKPTFINHLLEPIKSIGNYFETPEEAERAVEKLKAWKRLKDKGIEVVGWDYSDNVDLNGCSFFNDDFIVGLRAGDIDEEDLDLLFGGEE